MRKLISFILVLCLVVSISPISAFASSTQIDDYAVYVSNGLDMTVGNGYIEGNVIVSGGSAKFLDWKADALKSGTTYINSGVSFNYDNGNAYYESPLEAYVRTGVIKPNSSVSVPSYSQDVEAPTGIPLTSKTLDVKNTAVSVPGNAYYGTVSLSGNNPTLNITAPSGSTTYVVIDQLTLDSNSFLNIVGDGNVVLYVGNITQVTSGKNKGTISFNKSGNPSQLFAYFAQSTALSLNNFGMKGTLYAPNASITLDGNNPIGSYNGQSIHIFGDIYSDKPASIGSNICVVGSLYLPNTNVVLSGSSTIYGSVYAASLAMQGSSSVRKASAPAGTVNFNLSVKDPNATPDEPDPEFPTIPKKDIVLSFNYAYLYGYSYGEVGANDEIKREEAAAILYRILKQNDQLGDFVPPSVPTFSDVGLGTWSYNAMEYMGSQGVFGSNKKVNPYQPITRGEIAKMVSLTLGLQPNMGVSMPFTDIDTSNPNYIYIKALYDSGVFYGRTATTVAPEEYMTRAEYVTMINRLIGRTTALYDISNQSSPFPDLVEGSWYYNDIMLASLGFSPVPGDDGKYKVDPAYKPDRSTIDYN
ncbi:MAG: S-layer homology domain-containing protein [Bacillota bacterium]|nr:S-layer homology domain-containing protein [Bacillota bacterium]